MSFNFENKSAIRTLRHSKLKIGNQTIETPHHIENHLEQNRLAKGFKLIEETKPKLLFNEIINDNLSERNLIDGIISDDDKTINICENIHKYIQKNQENFVHFRLSQKTELSRYELSKLVQMQVDIGLLSIITIPDPTNSFNTNWEEGMKIAIREAKVGMETGRAKTIMPTISLEQPIELVEKKVNWLLNNNMPIICFRAHGKFPAKLHSATNLIVTQNENIWIHLFDLSKQFLYVSQLHLVPLVGVDTVSLRKPRGFGSKASSKETGKFPTPEGVPLEVTPSEKEVKTRAKDKYLFERDALGYMSESERTKQYGHELSCDCPICNRTKDIDSFRELISRYDRKALLQIHEHVSFEQEMSLLKDSIRENEIYNYFGQKLFIRQKRKDLSKRYPELNLHVDKPLNSYFSKD